LTQSKTASAPCSPAASIKGSAFVLVVNSGNANAFTGKRAATPSISRSHAAKARM
jgi:N-acetylglutamate synthase/N-acetylornithine aminotransferase